MPEIGTPRISVKSSYISFEYGNIKGKGDAEVIVDDNGIQVIGKKKTGILSSEPFSILIRWDEIKRVKYEKKGLLRLPKCIRIVLDSGPDFIIKFTAKGIDTGAWVRHKIGPLLSALKQHCSSRGIPYEG